MISAVDAGPASAARGETVSQSGPREPVMSKSLFIATDFCDDVFRHGPLEREQLDQMLDYFARIGIARIDWVGSFMTAIGPTYSLGFDPLVYLVEGAHKRGIKVCFVWKPFEGGLGEALPHSFPQPDEPTYLNDLRGILFHIDPWLCANPQYRMKRKPEPPQPEGPIHTIKLVQQDSRPSRIKKHHLSIRTGMTNNQFKPYDGDFTFTDAVEQRLSFPRSRDMRVLTLSGLNISSDQTYLIVDCSLADGDGSFTNETGKLVEFYDKQGNQIIATPGTKFPGEKLINRFRGILPVTAYGRHPDVRAIIEDEAAFAAHFDDFYMFDHHYHNVAVAPGMSSTIDAQGYAAAARGAAEYLPGMLHPAHQQVQEYWLSQVQYVLDAGVDQVCFRDTTHSATSFDAVAYGFNEPVLDSCNRGSDLDALSRANGDALTESLRRVATLIRERGLPIEVQVIGPHIGVTDERPGTPRAMQPLVDRQWQTWIAEFAQSVQIRTHGIYREQPHRYVIDRISRVAKDAGCKVVYQCRVKSPDYDYGRQNMAWHMQYANEHERVDAFLLYESAVMFTSDDAGNLAGSSGVAELAQKFFT